MKKLYILLLIICLAWMIKLSYDVFKISAQQNDLIQISHQLEKANSNLNDQLVASQRSSSHDKIKDVPQEKINADELPNDLIKQQLTLIEFSLKQQEPYYALDKLIELKQKIVAYPISPTLKGSLEKSIEKDIDALKQYIANQTEQNQIIQKVLQQLDLELKHELLNTQLAPVQKTDQHFWQKWLSIDSVNQPATQLGQRALIIKEAQLRLIMARQILLSGQYAQYQSEMNAIQALLKQLPDQKAQQMVQQMEMIKQLAKIPYPKLTTRILIG